MATETATPFTDTECPPEESIRRLIDKDMPEAEQSVLTRHIDTCTDCQGRMDAIAVDGDLTLSGSLRHIDRTQPPAASAFWKAIGEAEGEVTGTYEAAPPSRPSNGKKKFSGELKLDFLDPPDVSDGEFIGKIGTFNIRRLIGRGGMGAVLLGNDASLGRDVAIKILDPQLANNQTAHERFCREAKAAASVSHDNLVAVYQVAEEKSGLPYIVMQLVNGESLEERLRRVGKLAIADAIRIGAQAASGLAAAHAIGLIHRDIKPGNILIESGTDKAKLTDFGLARAAEDVKLTRTGFVAGTPLYMAPEQARGEDVDPRSDLFALGSVLYESLAGKPPFDGTTPLAVLRRIADDEHPRLRRLNREVPDWLEDVIDQLLAKNPKDRFQTAAEVAELLGSRVKCAEPSAMTAAPCALPGASSRLFGRWRRRSPKMAGVATLAATFLFGGGAGGLVAWQSIPPEQKVIVERVVADIPLPPPAAPAVKPGPVGPDELAKFSADSGPAWAVSPSQDGKLVAVGYEDGTVKVWDVLTKRIKFNLIADEKGANGHTGPVWAVCLSPDGTRLVTGGEDGKVLEWDLSDMFGEKKPNAVSHGTSIRAVAVNWHADPVWVATGDGQGTLRVFNYGDTKEEKKFETRASITSVAFTGEDLGLSVAAAGTNKQVTVWEIPTDRRRFSPLAGHKGPVYAVASSRDGGVLASASWDGKVILWDMVTGVNLKEFEAEAGGVLALDFSCCGRMLATAGADGKVRVWDAEPKTPVLMATFDRHEGVVHAVRFSPDGKRLFTGGRDGTVRVWEVKH